MPSVPRFSLRQILLAFIALAIGLSIWRLPKGTWVDVPLAALSFFFVLSLCRHAAATRRLLIETTNLPQEQRWGGRLLVVLLLGTASTLILAWAFRFLAAAEILLLAPKDPFLAYVQLPTLPRDLALLAMLVATGLTPWQSAPAAPRPLRQKVYVVVAAAGTLFVILAYWADRLLIWFLVYLAISGVEATTRRADLSPELNVSSVVRIHDFTVGALAGLPLVIINVLLIGGLVMWWNNRRRRWLLLTCLAAGLAAQCGLVEWIAIHGIGQLSRPFREAIEAPSIPATIVVAAMISLAVGAFGWRRLAKASRAQQSYPISENTLFLHQTWAGSLLLGFAATAQVFFGMVDMYSAITTGGVRMAISLESIAYILTSEPAQILSIAAAVAGLSLALLRWRRRCEPVVDTLPCIDPMQFGLTTFSILILVVTSAPIIGAVSFSYWFLRFGYLR